MDPDHPWGTRVPQKRAQEGIRRPKDVFLEVNIVLERVLEGFGRGFGGVLEMLLALKIDGKSSEKQTKQSNEFLMDFLAKMPLKMIAFWRT